MSRFSRWLKSAVQADAQERPHLKPNDLPIFPWESTPTEYIEALDRDYASNGRYGKSRSPYGRVTVMDLHKVVTVLGLGLPEPLAGALLACPVSKTCGKIDNRIFSQTLDWAVRNFDNPEPETAPLLLLDCHVKKAGMFDWSFRPAGSSRHFPSALYGRGLADEVEDVPRRLICLVEIVVVESDFGPEVQFSFVKSYDPEAFYTEEFALFQGLTLAQSIRLEFGISNILKDFIFRDTNRADYEYMRSIYTRLIRPDMTDSAAAVEAGELRAQWTNFVMSRYPGAKLPFKLTAEAYGRWNDEVELPAARLIKTPLDAEEYAAEFMAAVGFTNVLVTPTGPDGGIDVASDEALAQVKFEGRKSTREQLQRLTGITLTQGAAALFFSLAGYTKAALDWAEATDMALFEFAYDGSLEAKSSLAVELYEVGSRALICRG